MKNRKSWMTTWPAIGSAFLVSVAAIDLSFWYGLKIAIWMSAQ
jgi:Mn2+/Fe2+ NRAMP family transporter